MPEEQVAPFPIGQWHARRSTGRFRRARAGMEKFSWYATEGAEKLFLGRHDSEQLNIEDQGCVRGDDARVSLRSVAQIWRDAQLALAANFHSGYAFFPSFDHVAFADGE